MQKHSTHVIDERAVHIFKGALPPEHWTTYDIHPDYGKDHKVELVEGGELTGVSFWVQVKGQKKVSRLHNGRVSFKLETKDLDYHTKLQVPVFLVVVNVTSGVGYWVFTQKYERTQLRNFAWRAQRYIQIRIPASNTLFELGTLRQAAKDAVRYMTGFAFHADLGAEKARLEAIDPRFTVDITAGTGGYHCHFHSEHEIPVGFSYRQGDPDSGKIEEMLDRGLPILVRSGEIVMSGSPVFDYLLDLAGERDVQLEFNKTADFIANLLRKDRTGEVRARIDAIPGKIVFGRKEARIEAKLPLEMLSLNMTIPYELAGTSPAHMQVNLSAWGGRRLMDLVYFDQLAALFVGWEPGDGLAFECFVPGQRVFGGSMDFGDDEPYRGISFHIETLAKARAVAVPRSANPTLTEGYESSRSVSEVHFLHEMLVGEGRRRPTPSSRFDVTLERRVLKKFLADVKEFSSLGTLNLHEDRSFPFLGELLRIESLERVVTNVRLVNTRRSLLAQLERSPNKKTFRLNWEATEATETILRERTVDEMPVVQAAIKAG